jgi:hypothetical protein
MTERKVPISERALFQRIQRRLKKDGQKVFRSRAGMQKMNLGTYHTVEIWTNTVKRSHIENLEDFGRECSVVADYEYLKQSGK